MNDSTISWQLFLDALKKQNPATIEIWLRRWIFTDAGVLVAPAKAQIPERLVSGESRTLHR